MTLRKLNDNEKQALSELDLDIDKAFQEMKDSEEIDVKTITIEALHKDGDLLAVAPQFDDFSNFEVSRILLNILVANARQCTDVENFIKTIISIWGTYDEAEGNS
ncbi:hypothetical protein [Lactococcus lactis]|uniref:Phage protein n=1 Tax=Lactococcus lactis TaxID=1358 RepID=A0AAW5TTW6_9LACT|nr:hypothetical protein [Lactococcus lactis]MCW2280953.1 hypothetical protein [Lactococcus lactis]